MPARLVVVISPARVAVRRVGRPHKAAVARRVAPVVEATTAATTAVGGHPVAVMAVEAGRPVVDRVVAHSIVDASLGP
jgi:hypothetical protein